METLFENDKIKVYKNFANEIFYQLKGTHVTLRIGEYSNVVQITFECNVKPTSVNGLSGFNFF